MLSLSRSSVLSIGLVLGVAGNAAHATFVTEYFNDYGTGTKDALIPRNGGSNWTGAWTGTTGPYYGSLNEHPAYGLSYSAVGYSNAGNQTDNNDGAAIAGNGGAANVATRTVSTSGADTGLTGTVWFSILYNGGSDAANAEGLLWIDRPDTSTSYVAIRTGIAKLRYNGTNIDRPTAEYVANSTTYLLLAKVVLNASGNNDSISFWVNPSLSGGEAGLGTPTLSGSGVDAFGNAISGIGISFAGNGKFDAIRISDNVNGFSDVTLVPEPALLTTATLAAGGLLVRRRRAQS